MNRSIFENIETRSGTLESIGHSIKTAMERCGYTEKFLEQRALSLWGPVVSELLGPLANQTTEVKEIREGQLIVKVDKAAWRHRLSIEVPTLIRNINSRTGSRVVQSVRLV